MSDETDKLVNEMDENNGEYQANGKYDTLRADLEHISGDIQTVPSMPTISSDAQLTEEDIFRMKRLGMSKSLHASEMQSVVSVVDSTSNFGEHVADDNASNTSEGMDMSMRNDVTANLSDEDLLSPVQNEREVHVCFSFVNVCNLHNNLL